MESVKRVAVVSAQQPLIFMHLPKTGGMSMFAAFTSLWRNSIADLYNVSSRNAHIAEQALQNPDNILYCGHYSFGLHEWLSRPAYYASVLREPVSRIVSLYQYCQPMLRQYRALLQEADGDIGKLRTNPKLSDYYFDFLPCLSGELSAENFFASPSAELDNGMVRRFSGHGLNPESCPESALAKAKFNIEHYFSVVGLLERYPETLELMSRTFRLPPLTNNHVNKNHPEANKVPLDEAILQKIRDMNQLDIALYEWVSARFSAQLVSPRAISMPGGGRTGVAGMPLWLGVGESPIREAAMKQGGVPKREPKPVVCQRLARVRVKSGVILAEMSTMVQNPRDSAQPDGLVCLALKPELARTMIEALGKALEVCEKKPAI